MSRPLLSVGARGSLVAVVQQCLQASGNYSSSIDGSFGNGTQDALRCFQRVKALDPTGLVDGMCWQALTGKPLPSLQARILEVTASFEGHGYTVAKGNFDGAWLTWGIIGFTLKSGSLIELYQRIRQAHPECLAKAFATRQSEFEAMLNSGANGRQKWAEANTIQGDLVDPWRAAFGKLGEFPEVQQIQRDVVEAHYYQPAIRTARRFGLRSELGIGLCFDIHVQNGGINSAAARLIEQKMKKGPSEQSLRNVIANGVADASALAFREDVRHRKLTYADGKGTVHGMSYVLADWGIGEYPADEVEATTNVVGAA
jgi:peptidoglycan hydrolase-like protein with peptidoglycan-binding domain